MTRTFAFPAGEPDSLAEAIESVTFSHGTPSMKITMVKPIIDWLELNWPDERLRIQQDAFLGSSVVILARPGGGDVYDGLCLPTNLVYGWALSMEARNVKDSRRRDILIEYQRICYQVLAGSRATTESMPHGGLVA